MAPFPISYANLLFVFVLFFISSNTLASTTLSDEVIEQWIQSQSAFVAWGEKNDQQLNTANNASNTQETDQHQNPLNMDISSLIQPLKASGLYDSATKLVQQFHFTNLESWADVTIRITSAAAAIELENNPKSFDTTELEVLQDSSKLSAQQKKLITDAIHKNKLMAQQLIKHSSNADKTAVKPFLSKIYHLMNATE